MGEEPTKVVCARDGHIIGSFQRIIGYDCVCSQHGGAVADTGLVH